MRSGALPNSATPRRDHHLSMARPSPPCRQRPWTTRLASGPASMAARRAGRHGRKGSARRSKQTEDGRRMMVAAVARHRRGPRAGRGRPQEQRNPGRARTLKRPRPHRPDRHHGRDARSARDRALPARASRRLRDERGQGQPGDDLRRPQGDRLQRCALARNRRQGPWPHRAPTLRRRRPLRCKSGTATPTSTGDARPCASSANARSSRPASAASR